MSLIKETGLSDKDIQLLRETFVDKYATLKGWNSKNLTQEQLFEITQQQGYKSPGLLKS